MTKKIFTCICHAKNNTLLFEYEFGVCKVEVLATIVSPHMVTDKKNTFYRNWNKIKN